MWKKLKLSWLEATNSAEMTRELLLLGARVDQSNTYRETPLHTAIKMGKEFALIQELLKHGANVNAVTKRNKTVLNHAITRSGTSLEIINELLFYGAHIDTLKGFDRTDLDNAVYCHIDPARAKLLIKYIYLRNRNKDYETIINLASYKDRNCCSELANFLDDCVCEVVQMKTDVIKDNLSLYNFFSNSFDRHLLCNNQLSVKLANMDYSARYPIYNDIILFKIKPFIERVNLITKLSEIQIYTKVDIVNQDIQIRRIALDHDSTYNITKYLFNHSLLNLIKAFDNPYIPPIESFSNGLTATDTKICDASTSYEPKRARLE
ncbi:ankyrin repeat, PH and SEC7 domain containing protein secG-like [Topomyia yanbarensis]|uniref:ankyrin repeat, PH and SEC7 domain containing protein secG-like n=1 Tax=Topomyia yanbarensis TaxID=2498891 RepID=UPI00273C0F1B|nr:ankyrin repeat, PH and SEC7 domain containing protein secG-like [Topomyia yanbarensis]